MKLRTLSTMVGVSGAMVASLYANAAPHLVIVSHNTTSAFLVANNLQSAVIGITGFSIEENLYGFYGTPNNPWTVATTGGTFFNVDSNPPYFDGIGQWAASVLNAPPIGAWDTGVLTNPTTSALGLIQATGGSNPIGFALFGQGQNTGPGDDVIWQTINPNGIPVPGTVNLLRLTWPNTHSATFSAAMYTRGIVPQEYNVSVTIPAVPSPGGLPTLVLTAMTGPRRSRQLAEPGARKVMP